MLNEALPPLAAGSDLSPFAEPSARPLDPAKFRDPLVTAKGERRAAVALDRLETLWINTGTLCNLACKSCYIESSPTNDALVYLSFAEAEAYFDEAQRLGTREIGFTGGEPFMNRDMMPMLRSALARGFEVLVLTNAMRPMRRFESALLELRARAADDARQPRSSHQGASRGGARRGQLAEGDRRASVALRQRLPHRHRRPAPARRKRGGGAGSLWPAVRRCRHPVEAGMVLFPGMDAALDVPEITEACWGILNLSPSR
jgi:hypothetical protein